MQRTKLTILGAFLMLFSLACCTRNEGKRVPADVRYAMDILWDKPDSARLLLEQISADTLSAYSAACRSLTLEHSRLKTGMTVDVDQLQENMDYFLAMHDNLHAGEAAYVLGTAYDIEGDHYMATRKLKQAESLLFSQKTHDSIPPVLLGMVCYKLGMNFESDWLYQEANACYNRALPYLKQAGYHLYIACTLRDLARTTRFIQADTTGISQTEEQSITALRDSLFSEALREAALLLDTTIYLDILDYAISFGVDVDTAALLDINRYMTTVLHQPRYAGDLAEYYLGTGQLDSARICLDIFAEDTATQSWSRDKWHYLQSRWLLEKHSYIEAYSILDDLYQNRQQSLVRDGQARTYAIARQYDVLREQEKNLRLTVHQQRLYLALSVVVAAMLVLALFLLLYRQKNKRREAEQQARIAALTAELTARRESLRRVLSERVELTRKMQMSEVMQGHKKDELPQWAQQFMESNLLTSQKQWDEFLAEFNAASANLLDRLKAEHAELTKTDLLISALIITGLSIQDICILLNQTKNTIWSRRLRIKTHLGLTEGDNLDRWLAEAFAENIKTAGS